MTANPNRAAYVQNWVKVLKEDPKMIVQAATKACAAVDWCCGIEKTKFTPSVGVNAEEKMEVSA